MKGDAGTVLSVSFEHESSAQIAIAPHVRAILPPPFRPRSGPCICENRRPASASPQCRPVCFREQGELELLPPHQQTRLAPLNLIQPDLEFNQCMAPSIIRRSLGALFKDWRPTCVSKMRLACPSRDGHGPFRSIPAALQQQVP